MASPEKRIFHTQKAWLGGLLFGFFLVLLAGAYLLGRLNPLGFPTILEEASFAISFGIFAAVGSYIIANQPANPIGWIYYAGGMGGIFSGFGAEYARYTLLTHPGSLPGGILIGALSNIGWTFLVLIIELLPLLFPDGKPPSPRWRWVGRLGMISWVIMVTSLLLTPTIELGEGGELGIVTNPIGLPGREGILELIGVAAYLFALVISVLSAISLIFRYRRAALQERLQIKWFTYAILLLVGWWAIGEFLGLELPPAVSDLSFAILISLLPITTAIGIFKYRLYDIDLIIRRTLVYGALTLTLILVYFGSVVLLQSLVTAASRPLTAVDGPPSTVAIVISTLAIAALFTPLRRRIQNTIDRRFFRYRYNAQKALEGFAASVRDKVELDQISADLLAVVQETMQPEQVNLWLKSSAGTVARSPMTSGRNREKRETDYGQ